MFSTPGSRSTVGGAPGTGATGTMSGGRRRDGVAVPLARPARPDSRGRSAARASIGLVQPARVAPGPAAPAGLIAAACPRRRRPAPRRRLGGQAGRRPRPAPAGPATPPPTMPSGAQIAQVQRSAPRSVDLARMADVPGGGHRAQVDDADAPARTTSSRDGVGVDQPVPRPCRASIRQQISTRSSPTSTIQIMAAIRKRVRA